ncbi:MAG: ATP-dependent RecD-like DNA helicase [Hydrogeniiclostridium sp.]
MQEEQLLEISGSVEQIVFRNEKNGYTILEINDGRELVTAVGSMPWVSVGEELRIMGIWVRHPTFGTQFKVEAFERYKPATASAILKYLSSGAVKGIGPSLAAQIVEAFGENTLEVMEKEPERLASIKGISAAKARKFSHEIQRAHGIREAMVRLGGYGISPEEALRIWKQYGPQCTDLIQENPYYLCEDGVDIDFSRVDTIAASMERPQDDNGRIRAGIVYVLKHNVKNGHTCLPADKLCAVAVSLLGVEPDLVSGNLEELCNEQSLISLWVGEQEMIFLPRYFRSELYIAERIDMAIKFPAQSIGGADEYIARLEQEFGMEYAALQKQAIREALSKGMLILTGGPGTGKTTTLNAVIRLLEMKGEKVLLAAPTGRAAKRMSELTGREAKTIHRLLQVNWDENDKPVFSKNEKDLLECDAIVLDELSMVDVSLFEALLRAMPMGCRLIMVGDCDQLPSVGPGNVLGDLIASGRIPVVQLNEIFRQSMQSLIVTNAHRIIAGQPPELAVRSSDFFFLPCGEPESLPRLIVDLCARRLPASYGYSPYTDIQVLAPGRKGEVGTNELNKKLQAVINPPERGKKEITLNGTLFREGDKVMQIKNDYDLPWTKADGTMGEGIFNGDLGILLEIDRRSSSLTVQMDDRLVVYETETAGNELELAYAMTVHKSQGSEFQAVIIPMFPGPSQLYYRNLLYTAITRAKSLLILAGTKETIYRMVENNRKTKRYTGLLTFLGGGEQNNHEQ